MKHRLIIITVVLVGVLLLAGCVDIDIACGIGDGHTAYLQYDVRWALSSLSENDRESAYDTAREVIDYWESQGFEGNHNLSSNYYTFNTLEETDITLTLRKEVEAHSDEAAFDRLYELLCDTAVSPFMQVSADQMRTDAEQSYTFAADLDLTQLIPQGNLDELPQAVRTIVDRGLAQATGTCTVTLPGVPVTDGAQQQGESASMSAKLSFTQPVSLRLQTRASIDTQEPASQALEQLHDESEQLRLYTKIGVIVVGALALVCVILAIVAIVRASRRRRHSM